MLRSRFGCSLLTCMAALGLTAARVQACGKCHEKCATPCVEKVKCEKPVKGDLKCMSAKLDCGSGDWMLDARYYVVVKHARCEDFDVVLTPIFNDQELTDGNGNVIKMTVPVSATGYCHREGATLAIPENVDPKCLRVRGELVLRSTGQVLDDETAKPRVGACCKVKTCEVRTVCARPCDPCARFTTYAEPIYETRPVSYVETRVETRRPCGCH